MDTTHEAEFADFVRDRWPDLVRGAVFLGADASEAEELAQQTLVRCYVKWVHVRSADNREAYVYRILLNQLRNVRRTSWWRMRSDTEPDHPTQDSSDQLAVSDAVSRALDGLTREQRAVVVLRYFVQLSEAQTAEVLGIRPGTVKSRLSRSLAQLAGSVHLSDFAQEQR